MGNEKLLLQSVTILTDIDFISNIVSQDQPASDVIDKIRGTRNAEDFLIVYLDKDRKVLGLLNDITLAPFTKKLLDQKPVDTTFDVYISRMKVQDLPWEIDNNYVLEEQTTIRDLLNKMAMVGGSYFIVVNPIQQCLGKIKRNNALVKIRELL
jgi:hypothetical protein